MYVPCRVHLPQLSPNELISKAVVWHVQQLIDGNLLTDDGHTLILAIAEHRLRHYCRVLDLCHLSGVQQVIKLFF